LRGRFASELRYVCAGLIFLAGLAVLEPLFVTRSVPPPVASHSCPGATCLGGQTTAPRPDSLRPTPPPTPAPTNLPQPPPATPTPAAAVAPQPRSALLIRSVNDSLFDAHDQLMNDPVTQAMLRQHGTPIIRIPIRDSLTDADALRAFTAVRNSGAAPLAIVHGACVSNTYAVDAHWLNLLARVFSSGPVYVEYGNEEDLSCAGGSNGAAVYTASWNAVVPMLKARFPRYAFIGPVNFESNPAYVAAFVKGARPEPDFISWHEYVCNRVQPDSYCMGHIRRWAVHVSDTNAAVNAAVGHALPIMITEWNLGGADPRYGNPGFIGPWTRAALNEWASLVSSGVYAAFLYSCESHPDFELVTSRNTLTPQGESFFL
jgi:hypothetical protein